MSTAWRGTQARCYRVVRCLVDSAKDTSPLSERLKTNLLLDIAPAQLVDALDENQAKPVLASAVLSALAAYAFMLVQSTLSALHVTDVLLCEVQTRVFKCATKCDAMCRYCTLMHSPTAAQNGLPPLPQIAFSASTLETAAALLRAPASTQPALAPLEGLPCRAGFADAPIAFLDALLASGSNTPSHSAAHSSCLAAALLDVTAPAASPPPPLDLSPAGVLASCSALAAVIAARPHEDLLASDARIAWLLRLLSPEHLAALVVWPTHFAGNRKGVSRLLDAACVPLQQPFANQEAAAKDPVTRRIATGLHVRLTTRLLFLPTTLCLTVLITLQYHRSLFDGCHVPSVVRCT